MKVKNKTNIQYLQKLVGKHAKVKHGWRDIPCIINKFGFGPDNEILVYVQTPNYAGIKGWSKLLKRNIKYLTVDIKQPDEIKKDQDKINAIIDLKKEKEKFYNDKIALELRQKQEAKLELEKKIRKDKM